jgi:hypothetical protein
MMIQSLPYCYSCDDDDDDDDDYSQIEWSTNNVNYETHTWCSPSLRVTLLLIMPSSNLAIALKAISTPHH